METQREIPTERNQMRNLRFIVPALVAGIALLAPAGGLAAGASSQRALAPPALSELGRPSGLVRDKFVNTRAASARLQAADWWGGPITNSSGTSFQIFVSAKYPVNEAARRNWADFFGWAVHGPELSHLILFQAPSSDVEAICGSANELACTIGQTIDGQFYLYIVAPGDRGQDARKNLTEITLHEYGHHVAFYENNAPWFAWDWGAKRWATAVGVCRGVFAGALFPSAEDAAHYLLNPGEAFAETYRLLNVRRAIAASPDFYAGWGEPLPWRWTAFPFSDPVLAALQSDVVSPWSQPTRTTWTGTFGKNGGSVSRRFATPLDGSVQIALNSAPQGAALTVSDDAGRSASATRSVSATACGNRSYVARVQARRSGRFSLSVTAP